MQSIFGEIQQWVKSLRDVIAKRPRTVRDAGDQMKRLLFHTAAALTVTAGLSYIAGFVRDRILAQKFGATTDLDLYYASFVVPDLILAIVVTSTVGTAFIPLFTRAWQGSRDQASLYTYNILSTLLLIVAGLVIAAVALAPQITEFIAGDYSPEEKERFATLMQIMLVSPLIFAVSNVFGGVLLSARDFFFYGIAPVFYNLGIIIGVLFFTDQWGVYGLAIGTIFGALLHMLSRLFIGVGRVDFFRTLTRLSLWRAPEVRETFRLVFPKIFHIIAWQILLVWFVRLALETGEGGVTTYSYARNFQSMPVSLIGIAIALSTFTTLSYHAGRGAIAEFRATLRMQAVRVFVLTTGAAVILALIAHPLIQFAFGGGNFDAVAVRDTALLLQIYAISIPFESMAHLLARAHYAYKKTFMPSLINVCMILGIIVASYLLVPHIGLRVIPATFAGGLILQNIALYFSYRAIQRRMDMAHKE